MNTLRIEKPVLARIRALAQREGRLECLGLLGWKPGETVVSLATLLPAVTSPSSAEAEPLTLRRGADELRASGHLPAGIWHSHGNFPVFHSTTDDHTISRLMPAMASWNYRSHGLSLDAPQVLGPDSAVLPAAAGGQVVFNLLGEPLGDGQGHVRAQWTGVDVRFGPRGTKPVARLTTDLSRLLLEAGETVLSLGIPAGATVTARREDTAVYRVAHMFSLVVNNRGDACADCVIVRNCEGEIVVDQQPAEIRSEPDADDEPPSGSGTDARPVIPAPVAPWKRRRWLPGWWRSVA